MDVREDLGVIDAGQLQHGQQEIRRVDIDSQRERPPGMTFGADGIPLRVAGLTARRVAARP